MKKIMFGFLWFAVFYLAGAIVLGLIVGLGHQGESRAAVQTAATAAALQYHWVLIGGAVALAAIGTYLGFLPGTRKKQVDSPSRSG